MADKPFFNTNKYGLLTGEIHASNMTARPGVPIYPYADGSDDLANNKSSIIGLKHIPSGQAVYFKAFVTQFSENYDSTWERTPVFGRADPLFQFRNTQRGFSLGWSIPAASLAEGIENLEKVQNLVRFMYPSYNTVNSFNEEIRFNALGMAAPPLVRLKFVNMITRAANSDATVDVGTPSNDRRSVWAQSTSNPGKVSFDGTDVDTGLLGFISNVQINHNVETDVGVFHGDGAIVPKLIEVVIDFNPIHEDKLGWNMSTGTTGRSGQTRLVVEQGFGQFESTAIGMPASKSPGSAMAHSSFPYGLGSDFDPLRQGETLEAMQRAQADRVNMLQGRADKEAAEQIAQVRHSGFMGGMFKRADAKYYRKRMLDPSLNRDPYRMAAGSAADFYDPSTDRTSQREDLLRETRAAVDRDKHGGPKK